MTDVVYEFEGLRGVGRVRLSLASEQRVYTLFGANGVGKTKCLEALFQYHLFQNTELLRWLPNHDWPTAYQALVGGVSRGPQGQRVGHSFSQNYFYNWILQTQSDGVSLPCVFLGAGSRGHVQASNPHIQLAVPPIGTFEQRRDSYFSILSQGMKDGFSSLGMGGNLEQWFITRAQSANPYQKQGDNRRVEIDTLLALLHRIDERYDPKFLEIDGANHVSIKVAGEPRDLRNLSTGFTSLVKLLQAVIDGYGNFTNEVNLTQVKGYVFIDEIESHLHTRWQSRIVLLLKTLFPNTTFFLATHSPIVLSQLQAGEAYLLERQEDGVVESSAIRAPDKRILADVMVDAMGLNLNKLKVERLSADSQRETKDRLRRLLLETQQKEGGDA